MQTVIHQPTDFSVCVGSRTPFCLHYCRDKLWGVCVSTLALLPRVLRLMLQSLRVNRAGPEELPVVGQLLRLLLQHAPLRTHMLTNAILVQQIIKNITVRSTETWPWPFCTTEGSWAGHEGCSWEVRVPVHCLTPGIKLSVEISQASAAL